MAYGIASMPVNECCGDGRIEISVESGFQSSIPNSGEETTEAQRFTESTEKSDQGKGETKRVRDQSSVISVSSVPQ